MPFALAMVPSGYLIAFHNLAIRAFLSVVDFHGPMERETIRRIRDAVRLGKLGSRFTPTDVNRVLGIHWAGTFLPKHRVGNPGGFTELFVRVDRALYRLK
jgi:hypothetical protein